MRHSQSLERHRAKRDGIIAATATSVDENDLAVLEPVLVVWSVDENELAVVTIV
jgi:hypothetical protein